MNQASARGRERRCGQGNSFELNYYGHNRDLSRPAREKPVDGQEKPMLIIQKPQCTAEKYVLQTHRRRKARWQRSQGGV